MLQSPAKRVIAALLNHAENGSSKTETEVVAAAIEVAGETSQVAAAVEVAVAEVAAAPEAPAAEVAPEAPAAEAAPEAAPEA